MGEVFAPLSELDRPMLEVAREAEIVIARSPGTTTIWFKFTCENCLARQTFDQPNKLYTSGKCENCGHVTSLEKRGCGFLLVTTR